MYVCGVGAGGGGAGVAGAFLRTLPNEINDEKVLRSLRLYLRDIAPSIARRGEAERGSARRLFLKIRETAIRPTFELFQSQHWRSLREMGWSGWVHRVCPEFMHTVS